MHEFKQLKTEYTAAFPDFDQRKIFLKENYKCIHTFI